MHLFYVDESGDNGFQVGSTDYFILAGVSIPATAWKATFWAFRELRQNIAKHYGVRFEEIKGADLFEHRGPFFGSAMSSTNLEQVYSALIALLCQPSIDLFAVIGLKEEFIGTSRCTLTSQQRVKEFTRGMYRAFFDLCDDFLRQLAKETRTARTAVFFLDECPGREKHVRTGLRQYARRLDPTAPFPGTGIIEDPVFLNSKMSLFLQLADILAYSLGRMYRLQFVGSSGRRGVLECRPQLLSKLGPRLIRPYANTCSWP